MSFWIKVDVRQTGEVAATTYDMNSSGDPGMSIRTRTGATVSQALRSMAAAMVYVTAEPVKKEKV